jgi:spermidine/putrescine-binding protein
MTTMLKGMAATGLFALAVLTPAAAQNSDSIPVYTTYYYSDSSHQTLVGTIMGDCGWRWGGPYVQYRLFGTQTAHSYEELAYYCGPGGPEPF